MTTINSLKQFYDAAFDTAIEQSVFKALTTRAKLEKYIESYSDACCDDFKIMRERLDSKQIAQIADAREAYNTHKEEIDSQSAMEAIVYSLLK